MDQYSFYFAPSTQRYTISKRRFVHGHNTLKGVPRTKEVKEKVRQSVLKWHQQVGHSPETIEKIRKSMEKHREKLSKIHLGELNPSKRADVKKKMSLAQKGKKSIRYIDGRSYSRGEDWKEKRLLALQRDDYTCQDCGIKERRGLQVHHIIAWAETKDNSLENLITLCLKCHGEIEGKKGWGIPKSK